MVLVTGEVLGSTLGASNNVKIGLDDETDLGFLVGSPEGSNAGIPKGAFLGDKTEEARCGAWLIEPFYESLIFCLINHL